MAFDNSYTAVTGATLAAADWNTYVKGNFTAVWVGTTAGDTEYYTSSTAKARLAIGAAYTVNYSTGSAPAWGTLQTIAANAAIVASQASGDLIKGAGASSLGRVAVGALHTFVKSDGSSPSYGPLVYRRQGGSSTIWSTAGTTSYTPTKTLMQAGSISFAQSAGVGGTSVTFPTAFTYAPLVVTGVSGASSKRIAGTRLYSVSTTGFSMEVYDVDGDSQTLTIYWLALGE